MVILLFGNGVVAMDVLFNKGGYVDITVAWGLAVTMGIYIAGKTTGAHLNPAVTLTLAVFRDFPWKKVIPYFLVQTAGAFCGAAIVFWNYRPQFYVIDPLLEKTAGVFTTFPAFPHQPSAGLLDQIIGTALLLMMIFAITDERNLPPGSNLGPLMVGLIVVVIGMAFGGMHGYAINPARDFGPRLLTVVAGFKNNGLTDGSLVFWVPIAGPLIGGIVGGAAYDFLIRKHLPPISAA
jgi:glycerol uptake facilitator protein